MPQGYSHLLQEGGITLLTIVFMSIVVLTVGLERFFSTMRHRGRMHDALTRILGHLKDNNLTMAQAVNMSLPWHPGSDLFKLILAGSATGGELKRTQGRAVRLARRYLWILATAGAIAPFVGLFGTVIGIMVAFGQIAQEGSGGFQVVSAGISGALVSTAGGIFVGVEAVILFNWLQVRVSQYTAELRDAADELFDAAGKVVAHGDAKPAA